MHVLKLVTGIKLLYIGIMNVYLKKTNKVKGKTVRNNTKVTAIESGIQRLIIFVHIHKKYDRKKKRFH